MPGLADRHRRFRLDFARQHRLNQQRASDLPSQFQLRATHLRLQVVFVFRLAAKLLLKLPFLAPHPLGSNRHLAPHRILVNQLFKDDHLEGSPPNFRLLGLGETVVQLGIGKQGEHFAHQVAIGEHRAVHPHHRLAGYLNARLRDRRRSSRLRHVAGG